jgi:hypothetical protein
MHHATTLVTLFRTVKPPIRTTKFRRFGLTFLLIALAVAGIGAFVIRDP